MVWIVIRKVGDGKPSQVTVKKERAESETLQHIAAIDICINSFLYRNMKESTIKFNNRHWSIYKLCLILHKWAVGVIQ